MFDYAWNAMQVNDVGMDEFMTFCKLIDVDPYVTVNAGLGDAHSAAEEVEYLNGSASTYWGAIRAKNGHPEPYHIKYWNIGNEPWGTFQIGYTDLKYFVIKNNDFAKAMRKVDPTITSDWFGKDDGTDVAEGRRIARNTSTILNRCSDRIRLDRWPAREKLGHVRRNRTTLVRRRREDTSILNQGQGSAPGCTQ